MQRKKRDHSPIGNTIPISLEKLYEMFPHADKKIDSALARLSRQGVLRRVTKKDGEIEYSLRRMSDLLKLRSIFQSQTEGENLDMPPSAQHPRPSRIKIAPSVLIGLGGLVILVGIIIQEAFLPILILGGAALWFFLRRRGHVSDPFTHKKREVYSESENMTSIMTEAIRVRDAIVNQQSETDTHTQQKNKNEIDLLNTILQKMKKLSERERDFAWLRTTISTFDLQRKREAIAKDLESSLEHEHRDKLQAALEELDKQDAIQRKIRVQQTLIKQQLSTCLDILKNVLRNVQEEPDQHDSFSALEEKDRELTSYLDDLEKEYYGDNRT